MTAFMTAVSEDVVGTLAESDGPMTSSQLASATGYSQRTVMRALEKMLRRDEVVRIKGDRAHQWTLPGFEVPRRSPEVSVEARLEYRDRIMAILASSVVPLSSQEIADSLGIQRSTATSILILLRRDGRVRYVREDGSLWTLTPASDPSQTDLEGWA